MTATKTIEQIFGEALEAKAGQPRDFDNRRQIARLQDLALCGYPVSTRDVVVNGELRETQAAVETGRTHWAGRLAGIVGPVLVDVSISEAVSDRRGALTPSYYVEVNGEHRSGGFADHLLLPSGLPSGSTFADLVPLVDEVDGCDLLDALDAAGDEPLPAPGLPSWLGSWVAGDAAGNVVREGLTEGEANAMLEHRQVAWVAPAQQVAR